MYRQFLFRSETEKNIYPCKHLFYYIKVGFTGVHITRTCILDAFSSYKLSVIHGKISNM